MATSHLTRYIGGVHFLSKEEERFVRSLGTEKKPMVISEFALFWESLTYEERCWYWDEVMHLGNS